MTNEARLIITTSAAKLLVEIVMSLGYPCALCGEFASYRYGGPRVPQKVELVVFPPLTRPSMESLVTSIVQASTGPSRFFRDQDENSRILTYYHATIEGNKKRTCNVELTCLDQWNETSVGLVRDVGGLPVAPFSFVLLQRLEKWSQPLSEKHKKSKRRQARNDVDFMLALCELVDVDKTPLSPILHEASRRRVQEYRQEYAGHHIAWGKLGFESDPILRDPTRPHSPLQDPIKPGFQTSTTAGSQVFLQNPTRIQMVCLAAKTATDLIYTLGLSSALYGSLACFLYGSTRSPNDVDILALPLPGDTRTTEDIKTSLVRSDPTHFYLIPARKPGAGYNVLYYRLHDNINGAPAQSHTPLTSCKIDIVFPGTLHLPHLPLTKIEWDEGLPLVPFSLLLLQKLQGWDDHRKSEQVLKRLKQRTDAEDVMALLGLSEAAELRRVSADLWSDRRVFSLNFERMSRERVEDFCRAFPESGKMWSLLGFGT